METPLHPAIVHLPLALAAIVPFLILIFAYMIKVNKMHPSSWFIVVGLQFLIVASGYVAMQTGESEEERVESVVSKKFIHEHEEAAEIFVGFSVLSLLISLGSIFIPKDKSFHLKLLSGLVSFGSIYLAYRTGRLGGELVYHHGAATAYMAERSSSSLLPTPGLKTSESTFPENENESNKMDDHDYGQGNEEESISDEDLKVED